MRQKFWCFIWANSAWGGMKNQVLEEIRQDLEYMEMETMCPSKPKATEK